MRNFFNTIVTDPVDFIDLKKDLNAGDEEEQREQGLIEEKNYNFSNI